MQDTETLGLRHLLVLNKNTSLWAQWRVPLHTELHTEWDFTDAEPSLFFGFPAVNLWIKDLRCLSLTLFHSSMERHLYKRSSTAHKYREKKEKKTTLVLQYIKIIAPPFCLSQDSCRHFYCLDLMLKLLMLFFKWLQSLSLLFSPIPKYFHKLLRLALEQLLFPIPKGAIFLFYA